MMKTARNTKELVLSDSLSSRLGWMSMYYLTVNLRNLYKKYSKRVFIRLFWLKEIRTLRPFLQDEVCISIRQSSFSCII